METLENIPEWVIVGAALVTAIGVLWARVIRPTAKMLQRIDQSLAYVEQEMRFNGGSTQRDAIKRIDDAVQHLDQRLRAIEQNTNRIEKEVTDL